MWLCLKVKNQLQGEFYVLCLAIERSCSVHAASLHLSVPNIDLVGSRNSIEPVRPKYSIDVEMDFKR